MVEGKYVVMKVSKTRLISIITYKSNFSNNTKKIQRSF